MNLKSKQFTTVKPGKLSSFVTSGDINSGLREWKKYLKSNRIIETLQENKEYVKPSRKRNQNRERVKRKNEID